MSDDPATTPKDLPTAAQVQELIDLLIKVLKQTRNTEMADLIKDFITNLDTILAQLGRVGEDLARIAPAAPAIEALEGRMNRLDRRTQNISTMLTEIHKAMMGPIDPD